MSTELNPVQRGAVNHEEGPLLVSAGAGSGKTRVLTHRIAHLISDCGVLPWEILAVTFTNKAAKEMLERVERLVGPDAQMVWVRTFHSTCVRLLRFHAELLDFPNDFSIYDQNDSERLTRLVMSELGMDLKSHRPRSYHGRISAAKNDMIGPAEYEATAEAYLERQTAEVYREYQPRLAAAAAMDFDDLLLITLRLFEEHPEILEKYQDKFRYILVDEYQDTNKPQNELILKLGAKHRNVFVVGDSDQSIYRFRGAVLSNILEFGKTFEESSVILLEQNYRSTQNILDAANAVISHNSNRLPKQLRTTKPPGDPIRWFLLSDEREEAEWLASEITRLISEEQYRLSDIEEQYRLSDIAVMYRANAQSRAPETALRGAALKYKVIGAVGFYERMEIRDALAYLRVVANPADEMSLRRVLNVPRRGVGDASLRRLGKWARKQGLSFWEALKNAALAGVSVLARRGINEFLRLMEEARDRLEEGPREVLEFLLTESGYLGELTDVAEGDLISAGRLENLEELLGVASEFSDVGDFLEEVALVSPADLVETPEELAEDLPKVQLMTVHAAKGLEFPVVFLIGMEEGVFPISRALDEALDDSEALAEERRLAYVGITRAKERLYFSSVQRRHLWGTPMYNPPSRFIEDIPDELLEITYSESSSFGGRYFGSSPGEGSSFDAAASANRRRRRRDHYAEQIMSDSRSRTASARGFPRAVAPGALDAEDLSVGCDVSHQRWGEGVVTGIFWVNGEAEVTIMFSGVGEKRLVLSWAQLKRID